MRERDRKKKIFRQTETKSHKRMGTRQELKELKDSVLIPPEY